MDGFSWLIKSRYNTATAIICCEEMMAYEHFILRPSDNPTEWVVTSLESHEHTIEKIKQLFAKELAAVPKFENVYLHGIAIDLVRTGGELKLAECLFQNPILDIATARFVFKK